MVHGQPEHLLSVLLLFVVFLPRRHLCWEHRQALPQPFPVVFEFQMSNSAAVGFQNKVSDETDFHVGPFCVLAYLK